jgi:CCR4-NOT transcription complex subunit 1
LGSVSRLLDDLRGIRRNQKTEQLHEKLFECFQQWIAIFQCSASPEKNFFLFITKLTKEGILKMKDVSSFFFRVCAESSVNSYIKCMAAGNYDYAFLALDAMSKLIVYIIEYHGDASGVDNDQANVHYLTKILSIFVLVLANLHEEQGPNFQQKPFFRFFSSLVNGIESHLGPVYFQLLIAIRWVFAIPGFRNVLNGCSLVTPTARFSQHTFRVLRFHGCTDCSCLNYFSLKIARSVCLIIPYPIRSKTL